MEALTLALLELRLRSLTQVLTFVYTNVKHMTEAVSGFDWDDGNIEKCQKHGVSLEEIEALFLDKSLRISPDIKHSESENKFIATGVSIKGKYIFVGFTFREKQGKRLIRPISTRYMRDKEAKKYEENIS